MEKEISQAVIRRMPRYYRYLGELIDKGIDRISSYDLSVLMHVTASQIRQDLNNFGGFGQQGYGYNVNYLYDEIGKILGVNVVHNIVMIGAGNVGQAIANYVNFERIGFNVIALFDVNEDIIGQRIRDIEVLPMSQLEDFVKSHKVDIAALTLPKEPALTVSKQLIDYGVKAFWNFANVDIENENNELTIENVHLSESLMRLSYSIIRQGDK